MSDQLNIQLSNPLLLKTTIPASRVELANLGDLDDVDVIGAENNDVLKYQALTNTWVAGPLPAETEIDGGTF